MGDFSRKILALCLIGLTIQSAFCSIFLPAPSPNPETDSWGGSPSPSPENGSSGTSPPPGSGIPGAPSVPGPSIPETPLAPGIPYEPSAPGPAPSAPESDLLGKIFDVTKYGAVADGKTESEVAFLSAWSAACDWNGAPTYLIPQGTFFVKPITFEGPCYNMYPLRIEIGGTLKAPSDLHAFDEPSWIIIKNLNNFSLTGNGTGILDGQGKSSWARPGCKSNNRCKQYPPIIRFQRASNATVSNITLLNSKQYHMNFLDSSNIVVSHINITAPGNSPNTDGIHISQSSNIEIISSIIGVGDDCVSIGQGSTNINVFGLRCGPGHGISVGSLGKYSREKDVTGVHVRNCTINGTTNGVRIKTWPGKHAIKAYNMTFEDIRMINVSNPIIIDQKYCPGHACESDISSVEISNIHYKNIRGTSRTVSAVKLLCSPRVPCKNIQMDDINLTYANGSTSAKSTCANIKVAHFGMQKPDPCFDSP
ncbi:hypothetical protein IFM89_001393 [Coptis chinensis]|uniref:Polygalacturonase n=1 Tax=Coptis chinensis TaxID=261450 RepID=A0A835HVH0_9MAGN|nr:hypothetical protein IFM89_001393 [Coptis chinensis]